MLTQEDIDYMRRTADEYDTLLERWKYASAGSQEVANLHATFKARGGEVGRRVENGLFHRVLATLAAGVPECPVCAARPGEPHHSACSGGKLAKAIAADAAGVKEEDRG